MSKTLCPEKGCLNFFVRPHDGPPFAVHSHFDDDAAIIELIGYSSEVLERFRLEKLEERKNNAT